jgi:hypothetical protein
MNAKNAVGNVTEERKLAANNAVKTRSPAMPIFAWQKTIEAEYSNAHVLFD